MPASSPGRTSFSRLRYSDQPAGMNMDTPGVTISSKPSWSIGR